MKILMFGWEFPPHITGGLGTACYGIVKGLMKQDVEVTFVVPKAYGDEDSNIRLVNASDISLNLNDKFLTEYQNNLKYLEVNSKLIPYASDEEYFNILNSSQSGHIEHFSSVHTEKYEFSGKYGANIIEEVHRYALIASELVTQDNYDIIHAHDWLTYEAGILAKQKSGLPLVVHMHATEFDRSGENVNQVVYDIERRGMEQADMVFAVSNLTRNIVINKYGIDADKVKVVHNGVEPSESKDENIEEKAVNEKIVTFLGRITFQKGPEYFVEAANKVQQKDDEVRFVMAGSGDMLPKIVERVAKVRMGTKFHFAGFLKGQEVDKMFVQSDVYVMPSVSEPFGISPLEAMRSNVPVIISKQSGVSEVLKYALKVDFWDIDEMSDYMYALLHYDGISKMFSKYGRQEVDELKWEYATKIMKEFYETLI
ncbi:MAG: glycosyltransferase family 4 protein [Saprospiraceae bacterium]